ncbi:hypothetical protein JB92DRAFT_3124320 [Gautieria morchelliformis]|nr:hypothetical protein JB92DRAFT_3124320 [Gautieria morchelliformis]
MPSAPPPAPPPLLPALPMAHPTGKVAMPAPRSKKAPKMFNREDEDIAEFLKVCETCAGDVQLLKNEWVKAFNGHAAEDWEVFSVSIQEAFGGAFQMKKCTVVETTIFGSLLCAD